MNALNMGRFVLACWWWTHICVLMMTTTLFRDNERERERGQHRIWEDLIEHIKKQKKSMCQKCVMGYSSTKKKWMDVLFRIDAGRLIFERGDQKAEKEEE